MQILPDQKTAGFHLGPPEPRLMPGRLRHRTLSLVFFRARRDNSSITLGFVRAADGTITPFDPKGSTETQPAAINKKGLITGDYYDASGVSHGFLRKPSGQFTHFDPKRSIETVPQGINDGGSVTGTIAT